jgi:hypothetical protein
MKFAVHCANPYKLSKEQVTEFGWPADKDGDALSILDFGENPASVEIGTLDDLMLFIKKHGNVVLSEDTLLLYNDYLE